MPARNNFNAFAAASAYIDGEANTEERRFVATDPDALSMVTAARHAQQAVNALTPSAPSAAVRDRHIAVACAALGNARSDRVPQRAATRFALGVTFVGAAFAALTGASAIAIAAVFFVGVVGLMAAAAIDGL